MTMASNCSIMSVSSCGVRNRAVRPVSQSPPPEAYGNFLTLLQPLLATQPHVTIMRVAARADEMRRVMRMRTHSIWITCQPADWMLEYRRGRGAFGAIRRSTGPLTAADHLGSRAGRELLREAAC